ncbi:MAG: hypothetical protein IPH36_11130 [Saprospiraceae bacterium]|nr:hypothetical protein [Saprospiraceae bacterium]
MLQIPGAGNFFTTVKDFTKAEFNYKAAANLVQHIPAGDQFHLYNEILFSTYLSENGSPQEKRQIS